MAGDIYISYSAINDFLRCPGLYAWKYQYRSPETQFRVDLCNPNLILGIVFDKVRERVSYQNPTYRTLDFALGEYNRIFMMWYKAFCFENTAAEVPTRERGERLIRRYFGQPRFVMGKNLGGRFIKTLYKDTSNIYLCGSTDWLEENADGTLTLIDFKTGTREEKENSLQLPIYKYLVECATGKEVSKTYYWYLDKEDEPREIYLNGYQQSLEQLFSHADMLLEGIASKSCNCKELPSFCFDCSKFVRIKEGKGVHAFTDHNGKKEYYSA